MSGSLKLCLPKKQIFIAGRRLACSPLQRCLIGRNWHRFSLPRSWDITPATSLSFCAVHKTTVVVVEENDIKRREGIERVGNLLEENMEKIEKAGTLAGKSEIVEKAEKLVEAEMKGNDGSHDAAHAFRVRDLALSLAREEGLLHSMEIVELAALLHDIDDYKYKRDSSTESIVEKFLQDEGVNENKVMKILDIITRMGFKEELEGNLSGNESLELGVVQDADRLDAIGAIGIARCFTFGGSRHRVLHDPHVLPRSSLSKEAYMKKEEQTTVNHFHEKLLKLKDLMKTKAGQRRAQKRHKFMEEFLKEFYLEWDGKA